MHVVMANKSQSLFQFAFCISWQTTLKRTIFRW